MRFLIILLPLLATASALVSTTQIKEGLDNIYEYEQTVKTTIDNKPQSETHNKLEILIRHGSEPNSIVGRLKNLSPVPENITEDELRVLKDIESPFKLELTSDGLLKTLYGKKGEDRFALKTKDSIMALLLQNVTLIEEYLNRAEPIIRDEDCKSVTTLKKDAKEYVF